jgi:leucine dehydrogenase
MATCVRARFVSPRLSVFVVTAGGEPPGPSAPAPSLLPLPANGGLRLLPYRSDSSCLADGHRLAALMADKHGLYGTGFRGGKVVARAADPVTAKQELLQATGLLLQSLEGSMITGCDLNTSPADMAALAKLTPHVLAAVGSRIDASTCTAHGTLGALEAVRDTPGTALVHGCGAVGRVVARELIARGWRVTTIDLDPRRAAIAGARSLDARAAWWREPVDVLLPCSASGLITATMARQLGAAAIVPAANAPFQRPGLAETLRRRGLVVLPDPLVNAGAVIADSIERYAPEAWAVAEPEQVYGFVATTIRERSRRFLGRLRGGESGAAALAALARTAGGEEVPPIGTLFPGWVSRAAAVAPLTAAAGSRGASS